jgi:hypothetical protein
MGAWGGPCAAAVAVVAVAHTQIQASLMNDAVTSPPQE